MRDEDHEEVLRSTEELRDLLASCSTESIVGAYCAYSLRRTNPDEPPPALTSPARQWLFLLGLMLTSAEPSQPREFGEAELQKSIELLNTIFRAYAWAFFPQPGDDQDDRWRRVREVAMPAFLHYFNQGILATTDQVADRIERYLVPFNEILDRQLGLDATTALTICRAIIDQMQTSIDEISLAVEREEEARGALLERSARDGWDLARLKTEAQQGSYAAVAGDLVTGLQRFSSVNLRDLEAHVGQEPARAFWRLFSIGRGDGPDLTYITEDNIAYERPLFLTTPDRALCPVAHNLFLSVLTRFERHLASGTDRERFFRRRDLILEGEAEFCLTALMKGASDLRRSVYETVDRQFEHDLVIRWGRFVLVVEAKASPPKEPFRDPEKAFTRLRRAFGDERSIQGAYNQGKRIWKLWNGGERVQLFDDAGQLVLEFDKDSIDEVLLICVTRESFGPLAVDLSILLEKEATEPYPWVISILDLQAVADLWDYFSWDGARLIAFLRDRVCLHGKMFGSGDELEVVGFFVQHGGLRWIAEAAADRILLNPDYAKVFDRVYRARKGGPQVALEVSEPFAADFKKSLESEEIVPVRVGGSTAARKQGRNERCACGSGLKFKKCHGR